MRQKLISIFVISSGVLLVLTAVAKLIGSFGTARILNSLDPVFLISFGRTFQLAAVVELGVAAICFLNKNRILQTGLIALLATNFLLYRFGLHWVGYHGLCPCLGNLTDALHIPPRTADAAMKIILAYLLIGSYTILLWLWRQGKRASTSVPA
jgi:hypothetical protein